MFGTAGGVCPAPFVEVGFERADVVESRLLQQGWLCVVPERHLLRRGRCRMALAETENPPALLLEPTAPKVTLALYGRGGSVAVREYLRVVSEGVGFIVPPDLEPQVLAASRAPSVLRMRVLSGTRVRPDVGGNPPGQRVLLRPEHADMLARVPDEGLGFLECYDTLEEFLGGPSRGAASVVDGEIVSICVIYAQIDFACEVGVYTRPEFRRQGHGTAAAAACLREVMRRRWQPVWTAVDEVSRRLGVRLGLAPVGEKLYVVFRQPGR